MPGIFGFPLKRLRSRLTKLPYSDYRDRSRRVWAASLNHLGPRTPIVFESFLPSMHG
jgi:hypothetical protein